MNSIKIFRTKNGLSQSALAELLGVCQQAVAQWETSKTLPRGETLIKLADLFGCSIDELYGRDPPGRGREAAEGRESA